MEQNLMERIALNQLDQSNDWQEISKMDFTEEQLYELRYNLDWTVVLQNRESISDELLDKILSEGIFDFSDEYSHRKLRRLISSKLSDFNLIKKYRPILFLDIILRKNKFKIAEIAQLVKQPEIGMGATVHYGSDNYPYTIIEINKTGTKIKIQEDDYIQDKGYDYFENQVHTFKANPNGRILDVSLRKNGSWKICNSESPVSIGRRHKYSDPHF